MQPRFLPSFQREIAGLASVIYLTGNGAELALLLPEKGRWFRLIAYLESVERSKFFAVAARVSDHNAEAD